MGHDLYILMVGKHFGSVSGHLTLCSSSLSVLRKKKLIISDRDKGVTRETCGVTLFNSNIRTFVGLL